MVADQQTPMSPEELLRNWEKKLMADQEYEFIANRIGLPALLDSIDDGSFDRDSLGWMNHFRIAVQNGIFPAREAILLVAKAFGKYLESHGALSLDQAFGLKSKQRAGNPAKRMSARESRNAYCYEMLKFRTVKPGAALVEAAEHASRVLDIDKPDCETMAKYYSEEKWVDLEQSQDAVATGDGPPTSRK